MTSILNFFHNLAGLDKPWPQYLDNTNSKLLFSVAIAFLFISWIFIRKKNPSLPPGPRGLPLIGNLASLDPELHTYFAHLAQTYGPILKLQFAKKIGIIITSPALAREVLKDNDITFANRDVPIAAAAGAYGGSDIVWSPYGAEWRMLRKVCVVKMLSNATLDSVYDLRREEMRQTVGYLYKRVGSPVNIGEQMFFCVLNVITNMLWGGTVSGEAKASLGDEFRQAVNEMTEGLLKPNLSDFFPGLARFDLQGVAKKMKGLGLWFDRIFDSVIDQRLKMDGEETKSTEVNAGGSKDFLHFLLKLKDEEDAKTPFTMNHLKALLLDMVVGGTDTSSNTIEFAMAEMMNNPEVMKKVQQELETVVGKDKVVEESHINKLPYLHTVMKETLRMHPVLPLLVPHCPSESCTVGGYTIPKGVRVFINVWAIHRDPSVWENPSVFDPDRFSNSKWDYNGNDFSYFPFGSGRRICAGTAMAERMVMFSLATLVHSFDWELAQGEKSDILEKFGIVLKKRTPLIAIPTPRLSDLALYE